MTKSGMAPQITNLKLSKHFCEQWRRYFHAEVPGAAYILRLIKRSIQLQWGQHLQRMDGARYKLLSMYWYPAKALVIKVDWASDPPEAVTVITEKSRAQRGKA